MPDGDFAALDSCAVSAGVDEWLQALASSESATNPTTELRKREKKAEPEQATAIMTSKRRGW